MRLVQFGVGKSRGGEGLHRKRSALFQPVAVQKVSEGSLLCAHVAPDELRHDQRHIQALDIHLSRLDEVQGADGYEGGFLDGMVLRIEL